MKRIISIMLAAALIISAMAGCRTEDGEEGGTARIGISMPTQSLQRWNQDGANMKAQFEAAGYVVDLQFAGDNDIPTQISQLENMIATGVDVLVIAAIDAFSLGFVLEEAVAKGIPVIAYDRLIMDTAAVSYYATFDNWLVGALQGTFLRDALDLDNAEGPFNIELFTGDPADNNIHFFFGGAMEVLMPYIESGKLVVPSGQIEQAQVATPMWSTERAQERMENLISAQGYGPTGTPLHAVLSSNDSVAQGITNALLAVGYDADNFPLLTGQDCDIASMKNILAGHQSMSVFKDTRTLAAQVVLMVDALLKGEPVPVNDTEIYDNGVKVVPSFQCVPVFGDINNYVELLIDSGYYTMDQLQ
ncbi:MAG: sugar-binding protein [Defluviitaleaceae bacterium]|nr:sugar-binding protein [Defluviitaleaceae bacterium]MCL2835558.1 sugar-binding protein [Defluviitaleaceae bacterium]